MGGLSQTEFARRCKVSAATVSLWLKGDRTPSYERLVTIAEVCGLTVSQLVDGVEAAKYLPPVEEAPTPIEPVGTPHHIGDAPPPGDEDESELPNEAA